MGKPLSATPTRSTVGSNKYGARKTQVHGITFDSKAEARYYLLLLSRKQAGEIADFRCQPEYVLQEKFRNADGKARAAIKYTADFEVTYPDGRVEVVDVKASKKFLTDVYRIKKKLFEKRYDPLTITEVYVDDIRKLC